MKKYMRIVLFLLILLFAGCSSTKKSKNDQTIMPEKPQEPSSQSSIPTEIPAAPSAVTAIPEEDASLEEDIENTSELTPAPLIQDQKDFYQYYNFINRLPIAEAFGLRFEYSYDGIIVRTNKETGEKTQFHVAEKAFSEQYPQTLFSENDWYFMGCLLTEDTYYLRYDSIGSISYSFLLKMDIYGESVTIDVAKPYQETESMNYFMVMDHSVFYTSFDELIQLEDGISKTVYTFDENNTIHELFPSKDALYMICEDENGIRNLLVYDPAEQKVNTVLQDCQAQFLYIYEDYVLLSILEDKSLCYYGLADQTYHYLKLANDDDSYFSMPYLSKEGLYTAIYSWEDQDETKLVRLDLKNNSVDKYIRFGRKFSHILGIINDIVYLEDGSTFHSYNLITGDELP